MRYSRSEVVRKLAVSGYYASPFLALATVKLDVSVTHVVHHKERKPCHNDSDYNALSD